MKSVAVKDIVAGSYFSDAIYLDSRFILTAPEMPVKNELIRALIEWDYREVFSDGENIGTTLAAPTAASASGVEPTSGEDSENGILGTTSQADNAKVQKAYEFYKRFQTYVENLFVRFTTKGEIPQGDLAERIKELCEVIKEDRRFLLRIQTPGTESENYLASHTVRSTIIAVVMGTALKLPNHRLIELGTAALLHEIGMVKLPQQYYMTDRPLSPAERKGILTHPILGYNILRGLSFPLEVCIVALEHHERENGDGYPRKMTGEKISLYSKIIAVACSYEALTAVRPYKTAKDGYASMIDLLKNVGKQYDDQIVRALVYSLSIYPIGLYVLLSNGKQGQVVDVNPENPRFPIVQIFNAPGPDGRDPLLETSQTGIHIMRPLTKTEVPVKK